MKRDLPYGPDGLLRPGRLDRLKVRLGLRERYVLVVGTHVNYDLGDQTVYSIFDVLRARYLHRIYDWRSYATTEDWYGSPEEARSGLAKLLAPVGSPANPRQPQVKIVGAVVVER